MLSRRQSKLVSYRRKRHYAVPIPLIIGLFAVGAVLIAAAFAFRDDESAAPEVPVDREITAHASAQSESKSGSSDRLVIAPKGGTDDVGDGAEKNAPKPDESLRAKKQAPAPEPRIDAEKTSGASRSDSAMVAFARLPVAEGAVAPQIGHYRIIDAEITYGKDARPEDILRAQATNYVVVSGDILGRIAKKHGCTIEQIQRANRLPDDQIKIGQKLLIPNCRDAEKIEALVPAESAPPAPRGRWWKRVGVDTKTLPKLMAAEGFKPPRKFMAFVLEFTFDGSRQVVTRERAFDYRGTSSTNTGWNPASSVKIFAAIAALRRIDELGFTSRAKVTFHGKKTYRTTVGELIEAAIIQSDNIAYNRVVQLASFDKLHNEILTDKFGITKTALNRAYQLTTWKSLGEDPSFRAAPAITVTEGKKTVKFPASHSKAHAVCGSSACTSLQDLAESSRRLMLQEQLPESESFNLRQPDLLVLRRAMRSEERTRGTEIVDRFAAVFRDSRVKFYSKPGFSEDWYTDNVYIFDPRFNQAWIVVMSGYPGRKSLNSAATAIAKIISSGKLRKIP